jgi:hypothetical protein
MVTTHAPAPLQPFLRPGRSQLQELRVEPAPEVAVSVTWVSSRNSDLHPVDAATPSVMMQLIPAGMDVIVPSPSPQPATVSVGWGFTLIKLCPVCPSAVAAIHAIPGATADTRPALLTVATASLSLDHVNDVVTSLPLAS